MEKNNIIFLFVIHFIMVLTLTSAILPCPSYNYSLLNRINSSKKLPKNNLKLEISAPPISNNPVDIKMSTIQSKTIDWVLWDVIGPGKYRVWVNDTNNNYYVWMNWTDWENNSNLKVPINKTTVGIFNYTIEYNNSGGEFGIPDTVMVRIIPYESWPQVPAGLPILIEALERQRFFTNLLNILKLVGILSGIGLLISITIIIKKRKRSNS